MSGTLTVTGSTISRNDYAGIYADDGISDGSLTALIVGNRLHDNYTYDVPDSINGHGILILSEGGSITFANNEVYHNCGDPSAVSSTTGILIGGSGVTGSIVNNQVYDHLSDSGQAVGIGLVTDSEFVIEKNRIFRNRGSQDAHMLSGGLLLGPNVGIEGDIAVRNNIIASNGFYGTYAQTGSR
jgi:hypothetical protein